MFIAPGFAEQANGLEEEFELLDTGWVAFNSPKVAFPDDHGRVLIAQVTLPACDVPILKNWRVGFRSGGFLSSETTGAHFIGPIYACAGEFTADGLIGFDDLAELLRYWGEDSALFEGPIGPEALATQLANWGPCCTLP